MKTELMNIPGKGICIVISGVSPNDFVFGGDKPIYGGGVFKDIHIIADCIRNGKKIAAIKEIRTQTGWGLKEAKEYCDRYTSNGYNQSEEMRIACADHFIREHMPRDTFDVDDFKL